MKTKLQRANEEVDYWEDKYWQSQAELENFKRQLLELLGVNKAIEKAIDDHMAIHHCGDD